MKKLFGWFFTAFAIVGVGTEWDHFVNHTQVNTGVGISMIVLFGTAGFMMLRSAYGRQQPKTIVIERAAPVAEPEQDAIEECALRLGGSVTVTDVASELGMGFSEAKQQLDRLEKAGNCTTETRDGAVFYDFARSTSKATSARLKNRIGGPQ